MSSKLVAIISVKLGIMIEMYVYLWRHITQRQAAVKELLTNCSDTPISAVKDIMHCLPDLEKMLCSAFHRKVRDFLA